MNGLDRKLKVSNINSVILMNYRLFCKKLILMPFAREKIAQTDVSPSEMEPKLVKSGAKTHSWETVREEKPRSFE